MIILGAAVLVGAVGIVGWSMRSRAPGRVAAPTPTTVTVHVPMTTTVPNDGGGSVPDVHSPAAIPPPTTALTPDDQFISWLNADGMYPENRAGSINNGRDVCVLFGRGMTTSAIIGITATQTGLPTFAAADFTRLAVNAFCPQYVGRLVQ